MNATTLSPAPSLPAHSGPALTVGRSAAHAVLPLFVLHVALWTGYGLHTGRLLLDAMTTPLGRADGVVFGLAYLAIATALWAVARLVSRRWAGAAGQALAAVAATATVLGVESFLVAGQPVAGAFPTATIALFVSALVVGGALLADGRRRLGMALVAFGATTMPLGFALPALLGGVLPEYVLFEAHFLAAGLLWAAVARTVPAAR